LRSGFQEKKPGKGKTRDKIEREELTDQKLPKFHGGKKKEIRVRTDAAKQEPAAGCYRGKEKEKIRGNADTSDRQPLNMVRNVANAARQVGTLISRVEYKFVNTEKKLGRIKGWYGPQVVV